MASEAAEREGRTYWGMTARGCDSCKAAPALLFCRADSAFLCGACDAKVHGANKLASRHERVWMCEVCEQAPAAVTCKADAAALCVSCDADIHSANPLARRHDRVPVQPFFDFLPKAPALHRRPQPQDEDDDDEEDDDGTHAGWPHQETKMETHNLFSDVDPYLDLDYAASMDAGFHPMDSVVPSRAPVAVPHVPAVPFYGVPDHGPYSKPSYVYASSLSHSVSSSDVGVVPETGSMAEISNPYVTGVPVNPAAVIPPAVAVAGMDREARVKRYREKRKNRKFEKTIRYASRKAYAETRPRVKGRFAKRAEMDGGGYGIVPTF